MKNFISLLQKCNLRKRLMLLFALSLSGAIFLMWAGESSAGLTQAEKSRITSQMVKFHIPFVGNQGQIDERVEFYAKTFGGTVFVSKDGEIFYSFPADKEKGFALKEELVGGKAKDVKGEGEAVTKVNYFWGNDPAKWKSDIATYDMVSLGEVYEGIELKLKAYGNNVEKLFFINPGAGPGKINVKLSGTKALEVNGAGELEVKTSLGIVKFTRPVAYQEEDGKRKYVEVAYRVEGDEYSFEVGDYDRTKELVIDPLLASTFLGGTYDDYATCIAFDNSGDIYVAGFTDSIDFPVTTGGYNTTYNSGVFVSKFDLNLQNLLASTFTSFENESGVYSMDIDNNGNVFIVGATGSYLTDFRKETTHFFTGTNYNGLRSKTFILKFDSNLQNLLAAISLNGSGGKDIATSIDIDDNGNIFIAGMTNSSDFPVSYGAYDTTHNGIGWDIFISKLDNNLERLLASTFLGGGASPDVYDNDYVFSLSVDNNGIVFVTGATSSSDFPTTLGSYNNIHKGLLDVFIAKFDNGLENLLASTFLGGSYVDYGMSTFIDSFGNVYVAGVTFSIDFPTMSNAFDPTYNGWEDVFVSKFDSDLTTLLASTYLGGSEQWGGDQACFAALDASGNIYVVGHTHSPDFPTTPGAFDRTLEPGITTAFVSKLDCDLEDLLASTFFGGQEYSYEDKAHCMAVSPIGRVYVVGSTRSPNFPIIPGSYDTSFNGYTTDAFVAKLDSTLGAVGPSWPFPDVSPTHWAFDYIEAIKEAGVTTGYGDGSYGPEDPVSRDQMAVFIIRALYGETFTYSPTPYFADVPSSHWAFKYIQKLKELGITTGCGSGQYCPEEMVTRDQMAAFIIRATVGEDFSYESASYFTDVSSNYWAFDYIQKLKELGITTGYGDGSYGPGDSVTRDQMAAFLWRAFLQ